MRALRRRPARVARVLLVGATLILVVGAAISGWRVADVSRVLFEKGIAAATGASVILESGGFTLTEGLTLRARNFRIAWPERSTRIEGRSLTISVELLPLLRRRLAVRQIAMEGGRVVLGESPVDSIKERPTRLPRVDLTGAVLRLQDVTLRYGGAEASQAGGQGVRFQDLAIQASRREDQSVSVSFAFAAEVSGANGPLPSWMPQLGGKGRLLLRGGEIVFDETVLSLGDRRVAGAGRGQMAEEGLSSSESPWSTRDVSFSLSGRASFGDEIPSQWSVEAGIRSTLLFPAALDLLPPETAGPIEMVGTVPLTGKILATAAGGSLEVTAALQGLERLHLLRLRKGAAASGWFKTRTIWEAGKDLSSEIELTLSQGEVFELPAQDVSVQALLRGGVFEVESIRFSLDQGKAEGQGRIESATADVELRIREGEANAFVSRLLGAPDRLYGKLSMDVHLRRVGTNRRELLQRATGNIEVVVEDGRLENVDLPARLLQMATLAHGGVLDFNFSQTFKTLSPEPVDHFELLSGRFEIAEGMARTENLVFVAHNLGLQGKGTIDLVGGAIDFVVEGQVPKESRDHAGPIDRALGLIRIGKALDLLRKIPGLNVVLGEIEKEHVFRLRLTGNLEGEKDVSDFAWVH